MIRNISGILSGLVVLFMTMVAYGAPLNIHKKVSEMCRDGKDCLGGWNKKTGIYFIALTKATISSKINKAEASEIALANAKKSIASFIGQQVSGHTEHKMEESTINDKTETKEFFSSVSRIDVNQFLRGVVLYESKVVDGEFQAIYYVSGKTIDLANDLRARIAEVPPGTVGAVGISVIVNDRIDLAKQQALNSALRLAIEQVLGTSVASTSQVQDNEKVRAKIFSHAAGFVDEHRIIEEGEVKGNYRVALVAKVSKDKLLSSYKAYLKSFGDPNFFIRTNNKELYLTFTKFFSGLGLKIISDKKNADYIIDAMGDFRKMKHPASGAAGVQLSLWIRIFDAKNGQELLSQKNDPRRSAVFYSSGPRQSDIAAEKAFAQIRRPLHESINKMIGNMVASGRNISVVIDNYSSAYSSELETIYNALEMVPGCSDLNRKIDNISQTVTITANYLGKMDNLEMFLRDRMNKDIKYKKMIPKTKSVETNQLILTY